MLPMKKLEGFCNYYNADLRTRVDIDSGSLIINVTIPSRNLALRHVVNIFESTDVPLCQELQTKIEKLIVATIISKLPSAVDEFEFRIKEWDERIKKGVI